MFAFLLKGVLGSYPKAELSLHFNQSCDRIDSWASVPMLTSESYCITPYIYLSLKVVELNLDAKPTDLHVGFQSIFYLERKVKVTVSHGTCVIR